MSETRSSRNVGGIVIGVIALVLAVVSVLSGCRTVGAGELGIKSTFGAVNGEPLNPGAHIVVPMIDNVTNMSIQTHAVTSQHVESASHDLQVVTTDVVLNYRLAPDKVKTIYINLSTAYRERIILPAIQEIVKASTAQYQAEALITERPRVRADIERSIVARLEPYGIIVEAVNITNFNFSPDFNHAIELKVVAEQRALQARNDLERIKIEAQQQIETAKA